MPISSHVCNDAHSHPGAPVALDCTPPAARLGDIRRTSGFRIGVLFLALFGCSFLGLFGYLYWQTTVYLRTQTDTALYRLVEPGALQPTEPTLQDIRDHATADVEGRTPRSLFDAQGHYLAGLIRKLPEGTLYDRPQELRWDSPSGQDRPIRFILHRLSDGTQVLVGQDVYDLHEFDELLVNALISSGVLLLMVGLLGAVWLGNATRLRLNHLGDAIKQIVEGDLSRRLPVHGSQDDIDRVSGVVNGMLDTLERLMGEVKGVCDDIAHDLRTPLTRLISGLERAQRRQPADHAPAIDAALTEANGLLLTFRALLRISEIEDSARRSQFKPVSLNQLALDAVELFEPLAEDRGIALTLQHDQPSATLPGDSQMLFDALCNLIDNAIKFSPEGGCVRVQVTGEPGQVGLVVSDTGPGIPATERDAVFRRLYRGESSRHTAGNGLGLSLVAAVARLHDLQVSVGDGGPGCVIALHR